MRGSKRLALVEQRQLAAANFHLPGDELGVFETGTTREDFTRHLDDIFTAEAAGDGLHVGRSVSLEDDLGDAVPVTQVDEDNPLVIAVAVYPATKSGNLSNMLDTQFAAGLGPVHRAIFR